METLKKSLENSSFRKLPYCRQWIDEEDITAVSNVLRGDYLTTGPTSKAFEDAFAKAVNAKNATVVSSGTAALHLAMLALGIGAEDAVIVPAVTFLASANCVEYVGARVIFADVDPRTGLMELEHIAAAYEAHPNEKIKAIIPVHLNGQTADLKAISEFAKERGLFIVEDACHALGTQYKDTVTGDCSYCDICIFSAHPVKTIAMGEGGILTTNSNQLDEKIKCLRSHGMTKNVDLFENKDLAYSPEGAVNGWYYEMQELGYNYRASDIHCALGLSQLKKLDVFLEKRRLYVEYYLSKIDTISPHIKPLAHTNHGAVGWHLFPILCDFEALNISRQRMMQALSDLGIFAQVHYLPIPYQPYYKHKYGEQNFPNAMKYYNSVMALPLYPAMSEDDIDYVLDALLKIIEG